MTWIMRISSLAAGEQVLFLTTSSSDDCSSHPFRWALPALECFSHACTAEYSRRIFCKPQAFLSSPKDFTLWILATLASLNTSFIFPTQDPTGHSWFPSWASAGLSWGSKAGQPYDSHPVSRPSGNTALCYHVQNLESCCFIDLILLVILGLGFFFSLLRQDRKVNTVPFTLSWKDKQSSTPFICMKCGHCIDRCHTTWKRYLDQSQETAYCMNSIYMMHPEIGKIFTVD